MSDGEAFSGVEPPIGEVAMEPWAEAAFKIGT